MPIDTLTETYTIGYGAPIRSLVISCPTGFSVSAFAVNRDTPAGASIVASAIDRLLPEGDLSRIRLNESYELPLQELVALGTWFWSESEEFEVRCFGTRNVGVCISAISKEGGAIAVSKRARLDDED